MPPQIPPSSSSETIATAQFNKAVEGCSRQDIIMELSARLSQKEADLRAANKEKAELQRRLAGEPGHEIERAYEGLLRHLGEREAEFRFAAMKNNSLTQRHHEIESAYRQLQNIVDLQVTTMKEQQQKIYLLEKDLKQKDRSGKLDMERMRSQLGDAIEAQRTALEEKNQQMELLEKSEETVSSLLEEMEEYKEREAEAKVTATEQARNLATKERTICELESKISELMQDMENLKESRSEDKSKFEAKEALLNVQREQNEDLMAQIENLEDDIAEQAKVIKDFEARFGGETRDDSPIDIVSLLNKCEEADILWTKIEERQKKFVAKENIIALLREENDALRNQEKELRKEISALHQAFETVDVKISGENVDMNYFLSQIRNNAKLNSRITELEEMMEEKGYTKDLIEEKKHLRQKELKLTSDIEKIDGIFEMLKPVLSEEDVVVPKLIAKLEESLAVLTDGGSALEENPSKLSSVGDADEDEYSVASNHSTDFNNEESKSSMFKCAESESCTGSKGLLSSSNEFLRVLQELKVGLHSIQKEGLCVAIDYNVFCSSDDNAQQAFGEEKEEQKQ